MREIKIWQMALIWGFVPFIPSFIYGFFLASNDSEINDVVFSFWVFLSLTVATLMFLRLNKTIVKERWQHFKLNFNKKEMLSVVLTQIFLSMGISYFTLGILSITDMNKALEFANDTLGYPTNNIELVLFTITVVILAPILEEVVFRKVLFNTLNKKFNFLFSAILSSVLFGIGHVSLAVIGAGVFGVACCILYRKYNNLVVPIVLHLVNNFISTIFTVIYYFTGDLNEEFTTISTFETNMSLLFGSIFMVVSLIVFMKFVKQNKQYMSKKLQAL